MSKRETRYLEKLEISLEISNEKLKNCLDELTRSQNDSEELVRWIATLERRNRELEEEADKRKTRQKKILEVDVLHQRSLGEQLHGSLAQHLCVAEMLVGDLLQRKKRGFEIQVQEIEHLLDYLKISENEARSLARGLIPVGPKGAKGLITALERMTDRACELRTNLDCWVETDGVEVNDDFAALELYYIVREAFNNALRHAQGTEIIIRFRTGRQGETIIEVEDNGKGIRKDDLEEDRGLGIEIMHHRAEIIDAQLEIKQREEGGTVVRCILPGH